MKQFILKETPQRDQMVPLDSQEAHYLIKVKRMKNGETLRCRAGNTLYDCSLDLNDPSAPALRVIEEIQNSENRELPPITLMQCLPKGKKIDLIIRQATEAGITGIQILNSDHSVAKINSVQFHKKSERWNQIIKEARQQSNSDVDTTLLSPIRIENLPDLEENEIGLFFHQAVLENNSLHGYLCECPSHVYFVIGSEGGLSDQEVSWLLNKGYHPIHLGPTVLRAETAAIYGAAAIRTLLWEKKSWKTLK